MEVMNLPVFYDKKQVVAPGDLLAEDNYLAGENTFKKGKKIYATRVGLFNYQNKRVYVVALKGFYNPHVGDLVIGRVVDVGFSGWMVDIKAPYPALLRASEALDRPFKPHQNDLSSIFDVGDLIVAGVIAYDRTRGPRLTVLEPGLGKIKNGQVVEVTPPKIPRVIGKKGSMINMLKKETRSQFTIGQNGIIHIVGKTPEDERLATLAILKIEEEAHINGLTDRVSEIFIKDKGGC